MLIEYNDKEFDIPDYKNYRLVSVVDQGKILCLHICFVRPDLLVIPYETFYGSGRYWFIKDDNGVCVKIENENRLDILTYFYRKICEGIHKYNTETR